MNKTLSCQSPKTDPAYDFAKSKYRRGFWVLRLENRGFVRLSWRNQLGGSHVDNSRLGAFYRPPLECGGSNCASDLGSLFQVNLEWRSRKAYKAADALIDISAKAGRPPRQTGSEAAKLLDTVFNVTVGSAATTPNRQSRSQFSAMGMSSRTVGPPRVRPCW
jgi:hypothetical protein